MAESEGLRKRGTSTSATEESRSCGTKAVMGTDGEEDFEVATTTDVIHRILDVKHYTMSDYIRSAAMLFPIVLFLFTNTPPWVFMAMFVFWRLAYNVGLGYLLHLQSKTQFLTKWMRSLDSKSVQYTFVKKLISSSMEVDNPGFKFEEYPYSYRAWLAFRHLVDLILNCDFVCYVIFCLSYMEAPESWGIGALVQYIFSIGVFVFSWWAKHDALRVVKDYAWYWGDFFFLLTNQDLVFDGIFEMFPHPMYSVGYSFYYGASLFSRSYFVFYVSLMAHFCQLAFLSFVENPHIEKTFPTPEQEKDPKEEEIMHTYFRNDMIVFKNFDMFRSSDLFLVIILFSAVFLVLFDLSIYYYILQMLFWRCFHSFGLGYILHRQSLHNWWNLHYIERGLSSVEAFENWKRIYNMSLCMTHTSFIILTLKMSSGISFGPLMVRQTLGVLLILINVWSSTSTFASLGEFGWFFGDFFIDDYRPEQLFYSGIYRYFNNPDATTGFAGYYGLALISDSLVLLLLAAFSQLCNVAFVIFVEREHMRKTYGVARSDGGIMRGIKIGVGRVLQHKSVQKVLNHPVARELSTELTGRADKVRKKVSALAMKFVPTQGDEEPEGEANGKQEGAAKTQTPEEKAKEEPINATIAPNENTESVANEVAPDAAKATECKGSSEDNSTA